MSLVPGSQPDPAEVKRVADSVLDLEGIDPPDWFIPILTKYLVNNPYDTNFTLELRGGNGFGTATCMEDHCWQDVLLDADPRRNQGGKSDGLGSLFNYQDHCREEKHLRGRNERCAKLGITILPSRGPAAFPDYNPLQPGQSSRPPQPSRSGSILALLDQNSPPPSHNAHAKLEPVDDHSHMVSTFTSSSPAPASSDRDSRPSAQDITQRYDVKPSATLLPRTSSSLASRGSRENAIVIDSDDESDVLEVSPSQVPMSLLKSTNRDQPLDHIDEASRLSQQSGFTSARTLIPQSSHAGFTGESWPNAGPQRHWLEMPSSSSGMPLDRKPQVPRERSAQSQDLRRSQSRLTPSMTIATETLTITEKRHRVHKEIAALRPLLRSHQPRHVQRLALDRLGELQQIRLSGYLSVWTMPPQALLEVSPEVNHLASKWTVLAAMQGPPLFQAPSLGNRFPTQLGDIAGPSSMTQTMPGGLASFGSGDLASAYPVAPLLDPRDLGALVPGEPGQAYQRPFDEAYGEEWDRPRNAQDLRDFFEGAMKDFGEDENVDEALQKLGLQSLNDKIPGLEITLMPHQVIGVRFLLDKERDKKYRGALLADQMGLGKTVQTIALMALNKPDDKIKSTLIVAPLALLQQWKTEIETKTSLGSMKVLIYHGQSRTKSLNQLKQFDVVLTTYGTMTAEIGTEENKQKKKKKDRSGSADSFASDDDDDVVVRKKGILFKMRWLRVVLDEAHLVRNRRTRAAKAVWELDAVYRLSLTGTPIVNTLDDIYVHLRFLGISHCQEWKVFRKEISSNQRKRPKLASKRVQAILRTCSIRRHKESTLNGRRLLELPPKETIVDELLFSPEERQIYNAVEARAQVRFNKYLKAGTVLKHYSVILALLMRLRQICCSPLLLRRNPNDPSHPHDLRVSDEELFAPIDAPRADDTSEVARATTLVGREFVDKVKTKLVERQRKLANIDVKGETSEEADRDGECPICFDTIVDACITSCSHEFCRACLDEIFTSPPTDITLADQQVQDGHRSCPMCRGVIERGKVFRLSAFLPRQPTPEDYDEAEEVDDELEGDIKPDIKPGQSKLSVKALGKRRADVSAVESETKKLRIDLKGKGRENGNSAGDHISLDDSDDADEAEEMPPSTKMKRMGELIEGYFAEAEDHKVIIFSQFVAYLDLCAAYLRTKRLGYVMFIGAMKPDEREQAVQSFSAPIRDASSPRIMLISLKAGGVGLNLTAAARVISLDLAWNAATEQQAVDRAHRIGQTKAVEVRRLVIADTVEQRILELQKHKSSLADGAMGEGTAGKLGRLTVQDLIHLFGVDRELED
ncbi:SNF2 family N-terminal domain-domain-containing protein [Naematelia encephala]|uniref:SNF2 family N-terminal domain-domain-containing protein n=1 Tax=Naematelia encephala TaxID=71784 RepID=A0A1Y2BD17_9TREE|nr:SNF2 family N-terminal domain-domain-containing protein [Naematelia encephala]